MITFFILCIVLGLVLAPFLVIFIKVKNKKPLTQLKEIKRELRENNPTLEYARKLRNEAADILPNLWKPDVLGEKEAKQLIEDIKELVSEIR